MDLEGMASSPLPLDLAEDQVAMGAAALAEEAGQEAATRSEADQPHLQACAATSPSTPTGAVRTTVNSATAIACATVTASHSRASGHAMRGIDRGCTSGAGVGHCGCGRGMGSGHFSDPSQKIRKMSECGFLGGYFVLTRALFISDSHPYPWSTP